MTIDLGGSATTTKHWVGASQAVAQVTTWTFGGTWESSDLITVTINGRTQSFTAGSTTTSTVVSTLATALSAVAAADNPEIARFDWTASTNDLIGTVKVAGVPITCTIATTETGGGAADAQTINGATSSTGTATTAASGPNFLNDSNNWIGGLPIDGDEIVISGDVPSILYGLDMSSVSLDSIRIDKSFTGTIGLPLRNEYGSYEANERYMRFGAVADARTTSIIVGIGEGSGSGRILINTNDAQTNVYVHGTARTALDSQASAFVFKGSHASNKLNVYDGDVGVAVTGRETATLATVNIRPATSSDRPTVRLGAGVGTVTTLNHYGGHLKTENAVTSGLQRGGTWKHYNGAIGTLTLYKDAVFHQHGDGTITTLHCRGEYNADESTVTHSITACNLYPGFKFYNELGNATVSNGYVMNRCGLQDGVLKIAENKTVTVT